MLEDKFNFREKVHVERGMGREGGRKKEIGEKGSEVCATREPVKQQQNGERGGELCVSGCTPYYQV